MQRLIGKATFRPVQVCCPVVFLPHRQASLTGAISKGIRKAQNDITRHERRQFERPWTKDGPSEHDAEGSVRSTRSSRWSGGAAFSDDEDLSGQSWRNSVSRYSRSAPTNRSERDHTPAEVSDKTNDGRTRPQLVSVPVSVPYTTAASEFVYGAAAVLAALEADRRKLYTLYIVHGQDELASRSPLDHRIKGVARVKGVTIRNVGTNWSSVLGKMTGGRPHNGYVLEASAVPVMPVTALLSCKARGEQISLHTAHLSHEDEVRLLNGAFKYEDRIVSITPTDGNRRHPFVLLLDRIFDPGNLGAILRSAYYFGVDAVILLNHGTAPLGPVAMKASAGAAEYVPILQIQREVDFIKQSRKNGWKFFSAVAPELDDSKVRKGKPQPDSIDFRTALSQSPCVLMLGNEGEGLRPHLVQLSSGVASISGVKSRTSVVDSLNVSVAAAVLIRDFLAGAVESDQTSTAQPASTEEALF